MYSACGLCRIFEDDCGIRVVDAIPWTRKLCSTMTIITRCARSPFPVLSAIDAAMGNGGFSPLAPLEEVEDALPGNRASEVLDESLTEEEFACLPKKEASFHQRSCTCPRLLRV